jgi:hypothetical protein
VNANPDVSWKLLQYLVGLIGAQQAGRRPRQNQRPPKVEA